MVCLSVHRCHWFLPAGSIVSPGAVDQVRVHRTARRRPEVGPDEAGVTEDRMCTDPLVSLLGRTRT
jgi:hypothetical protein